MRKVIVSALATLLVGQGVAWAQAQPKAGDTSTAARPGVPGAGTMPSMGPGGLPGGPPAKPAPAAPPGLEAMINLALRQYPEMRAAQAKVRESERAVAEAQQELAQVQRQIAQKITLLRAQWELQKRKVAIAEKSWQTKSEEVKSGRAPVSVADDSELKLLQEKAELARIEAELPSLDPAKQATVNNLNDWNLGPKWVDDPAWRIRLTETLSGLPASTPSVTPIADEHKKYRQALAAQVLNRQGHLTGTIADKIRKALDTEVTVDYSDWVLPSVLEDLQKQAKGLIAFQNAVAPQMAVEIISQGTLGAPGTLKENALKSVELKIPRIALKQVPLGAVLQAIEDLTYAKFVVRDYGVLVTRKSDLPPGALSLQQFWKDRPGAEKANVFTGPMMAPPPATAAPVK